MFDILNMAYMPRELLLASESWEGVFWVRRCYMYHVIVVLVFSLPLVYLSLLLSSTLGCLSSVVIVQGRSYLYARTHVRTWKNVEG